ncbi:Smr/MutS family protein [Sorangium sp. So ce233]|uniref:Smr/MutS family protein n=1 Tax=Sorangium sp. So ce233 TaxID=3133290 RepID=UPI003F60F721
MLRRLRAWLDRALSPRAPASPDPADTEAPEAGPRDSSDARDSPGARDSREPHDSPGDDIVVMPIEDAIDLHTFAPRDVASVVEEYLHEAQQRGFREVRIIHGRGKGVQRRIVQSVLSRHPAVDGFRDAPASRGGWGATVVWLKVAGDDAPS